MIKWEARLPKFWIQGSHHRSVHFQGLRSHRSIGTSLHDALCLGRQRFFGPKLEVIIGKKSGKQVGTPPFLSIVCPNLGWDSRFCNVFASQILYFVRAMMHGKGPSCCPGMKSWGSLDPQHVKHPSPDRTKAPQGRGLQGSNWTKYISPWETNFFERIWPWYSMI